MTSDARAVRDTSSITLLLGGVRAGKSGRAIALAEALMDARPGVRAGSDMLFVATAQAFDEEMVRRIAAHRAERSTRWRTLEVPADLVPALEAEWSAANAPAARIVVIDCLTLWVSNLLLAMDDTTHAEARIGEQAARLAALMRRTPHAHWILVSNEVGLGVVPPTVLGRVYRDALGRVNQLIAAAADRVELMVAGLVVPLKETATGPGPDAPRG